MRRVFGPRTVVEAVFLVAVPVIVLAAGQGPAVIIASAGSAYLLVILFEIVLWRVRPEEPHRQAAVQRAGVQEAPVLEAAVQEAAVQEAGQQEAGQQATEPVRVLPPPPLRAHTPPGPEPPAAEPGPAAPPAADPEPVRVLRPVPSPPEPEPEPGPGQEPEPAPEPPPAAAEPQTVVPIGVAAVRSETPRQWNVWDLERLARQHSGGDEVRDEERSFLLMYLRDFAGPDGLLPVDFDALVRDSFGDLVGAR